MRRLDAECARNNHLELDERVVDKIRQVASQSCADEVAVMCGGVWSPAIERFGEQMVSRMWCLISITFIGCVVLFPTVAL